jgi:hypothetical protein
VRSDKEEERRWGRKKSDLVRGKGGVEKSTDSGHNFKEETV